MHNMGKNPSKTSNINEIRNEWATVHYETNLFGMKGPRKMTVYIPSIKPDGSLVEYKPLKEDLAQAYQAGRREGITKLINKPPRWSPENDAFVLDFFDRVKKPSVKNFQLINELDEDYIFLQFGKYDENLFTMDFQWPMTPAQAFAICLSSFDTKLACE